VTIIAGLRLKYSARGIFSANYEKKRIHRKGFSLTNSNDRMKENIISDKIDYHQADEFLLRPQIPDLGELIKIDKL
jgi:hypothetical protein